MGSVENIKAMVKKLHVAAGDEMDARMWHGVLEAQEERESRIAAEHESSLWRMTMKGRIVRLAGIAGVVVVGVLVAKTLLKDSTGPAEDAGGQEIARVDEHKDAVGRTGDMGRQQGWTTATIGALSLAQRVARSSAIVRATLDEVTDECSRWRIKRVLFGDVEEATVDLRFFPVGIGRVQSMQDWKRDLEDAAGRSLTTEEVWEEFHRIYPAWPTLGREVILFLEQRDQGYDYMGAVYDVPAMTSLDDFEQRLLGVIESGEYKSAPAGHTGRL